MSGNMVDVYLHGPMAETYGFHHEFMISTPRDALSALEANFPTFRRDFLTYERWAFVCDGDVPEPSLSVRMPVARELHIVPQIDGEFFLAGAAILWLFPAIGATAANIIGGLLVTGLLIGASLLFAQKPKKLATTDDKAKDDSYSFSGPQNVTAQGVPVPVCYGRAWCGSVVVSASLITSVYPGFN